MTSKGSSEALLIPSNQMVLQLTLGITRIVEQESLDVALWVSADGNEWGAKPVVAFPQKFYLGLSSILVNLAAHPAHSLQIRWHVNRWGRGDLHPSFRFYVFAEPAPIPVTAG